MEFTDPSESTNRGFFIYLFNGDLVGIYGLLMVILVVIYTMGFNGDLWCFTIWQTNIASQFCLENHLSMVPGFHSCVSLPEGK